MEQITHDNCLNIIVTADFLKLPEVFQHIWDQYFAPNFVEIIDKCALNLSSICQTVVNDVAAKMPLESLLGIKDRADKFISNVFRHRIDLLLQKVSFYQCKVC